MRITNSVRKAIKPDVTRFVQFTLKEDNVVEAVVLEGTCKPYYLRAKGMTSSGLFVRQGMSAAPASWQQILQMTNMTDGNVFEEMRAVEQDLSFHEMESYFGRYGVPFEAGQFRRPGIT